MASTTATAPAPVATARWSDEADEEDADHHHHHHRHDGQQREVEDDVDADELPARVESEADENGVYTVTEYWVNDDGYKVKTVSRMRRRKVERRVNHAVAQRRKWSKFGDAARAGPGLERGITARGNEEVKMEWRKPAGGDGDDSDGDGDDDDGEPGDAGKGPRTGGGDGGGNDVMTNKSIVVCRICGKVGDHWTLKCPFRGLQGALGGNESGGGGDSSSGDARAPSMSGDHGGQSGAGAPDVAGEDGGRRGGRYVPPSMRTGAGSRVREGESMYGRRDENSIRISNLSDAATEDDLRQLLSAFGHVVRIYLARDRVTGAPKGFAFAAFAERSSTERCIEKLNGFGYDHLILSVEWARPSGDRAAVGGEGGGGGGEGGANLPPGGPPSGAFGGGGGAPPRPFGARPF